MEKEIDCINEQEAYSVKMYGQNKEELKARFDTRNSFYKKAHTIEYNGALYLQSYGTIVAKIENGKATINGWYSQTTARHINEFLKQNGFKAMTKKEIEE